MRWFWQRRRQKQATVQAAPQTPTSATATLPAASPAVQRAATTSGRLGQPLQLSSELLVLARDYLQAVGGRVRVEDEDVLSATLPDGSLVRYTTTLAKAHADDSMTLLVEGSEALGAMLDDIANRSRVSAVGLAPATDPIKLALDTCATPAAGCGQCLDAANGASQAHATICAVCPLHEGSLVLHWRARGSLTARVMRQEQASSVELAYLVVARDRHGRRDEWIRHAIDLTTGGALPILSETALAAAQADAVPIGYQDTLAAAHASAERALGEPLAATGIFLRQRSLDEYRQRLEEVATTFDRLQRESPETARAAKAGRSRELSALAEVYAVDVEAQLESACFISSTHALVAVRPQKGRGELLLRIDSGRQYVVPPDCSTCGTSIQAGYVCDSGHVTCPQCASACSHCGAWGCAACGEAAGTAAICPNCNRAVQQPASPDSNSAASAENGSFTVRHLEALPSEMWHSAMEWLLTRQGMTVDGRRVAGELAVWQAHSEASTTLVAAPRSQRKWALDEASIREAAAHLAPVQPNTARMILSTEPASEAARQVAMQLDIQLVDRNALQEILAGLASAHDRQRESQREETQARADAATSTRQVMLDTVKAVEQALAPLRRSRRASAQQTANAAGSRALAAARTAIERASIAWETLLAEWTAAFGERPARNGAFVIQAERAQFEEMAERAAHLRVAMLDAATLLAETPARGEAGYTAWRQAIVEEWAARCDAWQWRIRSYEPAEWSDFSRAWNAKTAAKAADATTAAGHATARADKAQAQALRAS